VQLLDALEDEEPELLRVRGGLGHLVEHEAGGRPSIRSITSSRKTQREDVFPSIGVTKEVFSFLMISW